MVSSPPSKTTLTPPLRPLSILRALPQSHILICLKEQRIIENTGKGGRQAAWRWIPASMPTDVLIEKLYKAYENRLQAYVSERRQRQDAARGIDRENSGPPVAVPHAKAGSEPRQNLFTLERLQSLEDQNRLIIDLLTTLCKNLDIKETAGGHQL